MSFSNRLHNVALGGCLAAAVYFALQGLVFAQGVSDSPARETRADKAKDQPKPDNTPLILEAIKNQIDRATNAMVAQNDEAAAKRKDEREDSDLKAQWEMSHWAKYMFYVTFGSLILTFIGVILIWRTLVYSKDAAEAAKAMVVESGKATQAALIAAAEAKRQADLTEQSTRRLERPYLFLEVTSHKRLSDNGSGRKPSLAYVVTNHGRLPAIFKAVFLELRPFADLQFTAKGIPRIGASAPKKQWYEVLPERGSTSERIVEVLNSEPGQTFAIDDHLVLHGLLEYDDPTGAYHSHHFVLVRKGGRFCLEYTSHHSEYPKEGAS